MNIAILTQGLATLAWIVTVGLLILVLSRAARNRPMKKGAMIVIVAAVLSILFTTVSSGLVFIKPEERGVVISAVAPKGYREEILQPGLRWVIPFAENVVRYPIGRENYTMSIAPSEGQIAGDDSITARTADGQEIFVDASIIYSVEPSQVIQVHIYWKDTYVEGLIRPLSRGVIRDVVSQYKVEEVVTTKRLEMAEQFRTQMTEKLAANGLICMISSCAISLFPRNMQPQWNKNRLPSSWLSKPNLWWNSASRRLNRPANLPKAVPIRSSSKPRVPQKPA